MSCCRRGVVPLVGKQFSRRDVEIYRNAFSFTLPDSDFDFNFYHFPGKDVKRLLVFGFAVTSIVKTNRVTHAFWRCLSNIAVFHPDKWHEQIVFRTIRKNFFFFFLYQYFIFKNYKKLLLLFKVISSGRSCLFVKVRRNCSEVIALSSATVFGLVWLFILKSAMIGANK